MNGNIITGSSNSKMSEIFQQVKKEKKSYIYESSLRAKNGEKIVTQTTLTPITDEFDRVYRLVAIDSDIRKLKHVENELQKLNATKDKFFSIIAHDLKNPFHSLLAATQTLRMKIKDYDKEKILFFLENMESVARRGYDLLVNLLEWSRSQTGRLDFKPEKTNLHQLVKNSVDLLKGAAENKGVKLENAVDNDIEVLVDRNTIATVLRNLISNGIKYTLKDDRVKIYAKREESTVFVYVEDTGTGIKKEHVAKLFRLDKNISTRGTQDETGTGLGLILCKEFVERNGGTIFVESTEGEGSTFYFTIPLADQG
jgi:signal transduction histidine kinase